MLHRLLIVLAQVKARITSEKLLNEIRQIIYSLYRPKAITKKVYNNLMNSKTYNTKINTKCMNFENSKTSDTR